MKWMLFFMVAIFIDGLQAVVELAMMGILAFGGTIGGGAAGYYACSGVGGIFATGCAAIGATAGSFLDPATATLGEPFGMAIGFGIDVAISLTFGVFLVTILLFTNSFSFKSVGLNLPGSGSKSKLGWLKFVAPLVEVIPGLDLLPTWTMLVYVCWSEKRGAEKSARMQPTTEPDQSGGVGALPYENQYANFEGENIDEQGDTASSYAYEYDASEETPREDASPLRSMGTDISPRAANDNTPQTYAKAA